MSSAEPNDQKQQLDPSSPPGLELATEIIPKRLFFVSIGTHPESTELRKFFTVDYDLVYEPYFADFGPLHLGHTVAFCRALHHQLEQLPPGGEIYFYTSHHGHQRANAGCLIGAFCVCMLRMSPQKVSSLLDAAYPPFLTFRDASYGVSTFGLTILDILQGLDKAIQLKWFDVHSFDLEDYNKYSQVEEGDFQWIIPGKMLAFSSPVDNEPGREARHLVRKFRERGVQCVVRLNERLYDKQAFLEVGIRHLEMPFPDGSVPSDAVVSNFFESVEKQYGAIAVHCRQGVGRTGTMIGLYAMKHYGFSAREFIGWSRLCRPGCVIGPQQQYLVQMEKRLSRYLKHGVGSVAGGKLPFMTPTEAWKQKLDNEETMYKQQPTLRAASATLASTTTTTKPLSGGGSSPTIKASNLKPVSPINSGKFKFASSAKLYEDTKEQKQQKERQQASRGVTPGMSRPSTVGPTTGSRPGFSGTNGGGGGAIVNPNATVSGSSIGRPGTVGNQSVMSAASRSKIAAVGSGTRRGSSATAIRPRSTGGAGEVLTDLLPGKNSHASSLYVKTVSVDGTMSQTLPSLLASGSGGSSGKVVKLSADSFDSNYSVNYDSTGSGGGSSFSQPTALLRSALSVSGSTASGDPSPVHRRRRSSGQNSALLVTS